MTEQKTSTRRAVRITKEGDNLFSVVPLGVSPRKLFEQNYFFADDEPLRCFFLFYQNPECFSKEDDLTILSCKLSVEELKDFIVSRVREKYEGSRFEELSNESWEDINFYWSRAKESKWVVLIWVLIALCSSILFDVTNNFSIEKLHEGDYKLNLVSNTGDLPTREFGHENNNTNTVLSSLMRAAQGTVVDCVGEYTQAHVTFPIGASGIDKKEKDILLTTQNVHLVPPGSAINILNPISHFSNIYDHLKTLFGQYNSTNTQTSVLFNPDENLEKRKQQTKANRFVLNILFSYLTMLRVCITFHIPTPLSMLVPAWVSQELMDLVYGIGLASDLSVLMKVLKFPTYENIVDITFRGDEKLIEILRENTMSIARYDGIKKSYVTNVQIRNLEQSKGAKNSAEILYWLNMFSVTMFGNVGKRRLASSVMIMLGLNVLAVSTLPVLDQTETTNTSPDVSFMYHFGYLWTIKYVAALCIHFGFQNKESRLKSISLWLLKVLSKAGQFTTNRVLNDNKKIKELNSRAQIDVELWDFIEVSLMEYKVLSSAIEKNLRKHGPSWQRVFAETVEMPWYLASMVGNNTLYIGKRSYDLLVLMSMNWKVILSHLISHSGYYSILGGGLAIGGSYTAWQHNIDILDLISTWIRELELFASEDCRNVYDNKQILNDELLKSRLNAEYIGDWETYRSKNFKRRI